MWATTKATTKKLFYQFPMFLAGVLATQAGWVEDFTDWARGMV